MKPTAKIIVISAFLAFCSVGLADELLVPTPYSTIQSAIDAAADGDTVIVAPGTYTGSGNRDIDFLGKAITVRSIDPNDPDIVAATVIDCNSAEPYHAFEISNIIDYDDETGFHQGFYFHSGEDTNSIIEGFTIIRGYPGGIYYKESSPKIKNCTIRDNISRGIYCYSESSPTITNCIISGNLVGIDCNESNPVITNCIISDNYACGIYCSESNSVITNCRISDNNDSGIYCLKGSSIITNCTIVGNTSTTGGGIRCSGSSTKIIDCTITGNTTEPSSGGGIYCNYSSPTITGCTITGNSANFYGGGIYCNHSSPAISNCIFSENSVKGNGGGLAFCDGPITNCIITGNYSIGSGGGLYECRGLIKNCTITNNSTSWSGGGIAYIKGGQIVNCTIANNSADKNGGGIGCFTGPIVNCTIANNSAIGSGGGLYYQGGPITNCIIWANQAQGNGPQISLTYSNTSLSYTDLQGGQDDVYIEPGCTLDWGPGNIDADPCFIELGYWADANDVNIIVEPNDPNAVWIDGDYHLLSTSSCIDAANDANVYTDIEGNVRPFDFPGVDNNGELPEFDMGAYELTPIEAQMKFTPPNLNCKSKGKFVKARITLPEGFTPEDVVLDTPALAYPMNLESEYLEVFLNDNGSVELEITFDRQSFCDSLTETGQAEITVIGSLTTGRYFYATDIITAKIQR